MTLFTIEVEKTFRRWRTYIGFAVILAAVLLLEVIIKLNESEMARNFAGGLNADFLVSGNILNAWVITAFVMNSLYIHVPFLIALVAGDMVSSEATSGTLRFMLIRPPSRSRIITSKFFAMLFYTALLIIFLGILCVGIGLLFFGGGDLIKFQPGMPHIVVLPAHIAASRTGLAFVAAILSMSVVGSLAFLFSTLVDNSIGPIIGSIAIVIISFILGNLPFEFAQTLRPYLFTTYMDIWQLMLDNPIDWVQVWKYALALLAYDGAFFAIAYYVFVRKDVKS
ncbi:MAG: ABC transporter permease [Bacteroidetes bacterium]|nr:ABC transporter permease [Bacteroidota bacterium]